MTKTGSESFKSKGIPKDFALTSGMPEALLRKALENDNSCGQELSFIPR